AGPGLSEYLSGQTNEVIDIIYPLGKSVYGSIIPAGEPLENAGFQAFQRPFSHLEQALSPNYHFVFYALPSIRQSYDAVALSRTLDGVIVLAYPGLSRVDELKSTLAELDAIGVPVLGIALQPA